MNTHVHLYYSDWGAESRAWRFGEACLSDGLADRVYYVGYKSQARTADTVRSSHERIVRLAPEPAKPGGSRLMRIIALPLWYWNCFKFVVNLNPVLIVSHSLASLPVALLISFWLRIKLIYDAHEIETERYGWSYFVRGLARVVEGALINKCDLILVVNESIRQWYEDKYRLCNVVSIRNIPDLPTPRSVESDRESLRYSLGLSEDVIIGVYCGALTYSRGLETLVDLYRCLGPKHHLVLLGDGLLRSSLESRAAVAKNISFLGFVDNKRLVPLLCTADIGYAISEVSCLSYYYALSNKVFEYAAAGLVILVGEGPEFERFISSYPAGRVVESRVEAILSFMKPLTKPAVDEIKGRARFFKVPDWQNEKEKLLAALKDVLRKSSGVGLER